MVEIRQLLARHAYSIIDDSEDEIIPFHITDNS